MLDLYGVLGVEQDATTEQIKKAHRRLAIKHHPDRGGDRKRFEQIQFAFEVLSDSERRERYDETGHAENQPEQDAIDEILAMAKGAFTRDDRDPIRVIEEAIDQERSQLQANRRKTKAAIEAMKRNLKNFQEERGKGEGSAKALIIEAVEDNIAAAEFDVTNLESRIEFCGKKLSLLNGLRGPESVYGASTQWSMPIRLDFQ